MKNIKNKFLWLFVISLGCAQVERIQASQFGKMLGKSAIAAATMQATKRSSMESAYPQDDVYNHNVMNGSFFDHKFTNKDEKRQYIAAHFKQMNVATDINDVLIDLCTEGMDHTPRRIGAFMNNAKCLAVRDKSDSVTLKHLERSLMNNGVMDADDSEDTAEVLYHEIGHAVIALTQNSGKNLAWISILPCPSDSGLEAAGYILSLPSTDQKTHDQKLNDIKVALAGGIAEQVFGFHEQRNLTTYEELKADFLSRFGIVADYYHGESSAFHTAQSLAKDKMMNDKIDCILSLSQSSGKDLLDEKDFAEIYFDCQWEQLHKKNLDEETEEIIKEQYLATVASIKALQSEIKAIAQELLKEKVLSGKTVQEIIARTQHDKK